MKAAAVFHEARQRDAKAYVFPEIPVNLLGYARLQAGDKEEAIELFKLNTKEKIAKLKSAEVNRVTVPLGDRS